MRLGRFRQTWLPWRARKTGACSGEPHAARRRRPGTRIRGRELQTRTVASPPGLWFGPGLRLMPGTSRCQCVAQESSRVVVAPPDTMDTDLEPPRGYPNPCRAVTRGSPKRACSVPTAGTPRPVRDLAPPDQLGRCAKRSANHKADASADGSPEPAHFEATTARSSPLPPGRAADCRPPQSFTPARPVSVRRTCNRTCPSHTSSGPSRTTSSSRTPST